MEDVFSLGLTFLQMARLIREKDLDKFKLNKDASFTKELPTWLIEYTTLEEYKAMNKEQ